MWISRPAYRRWPWEKQTTWQKWGRQCKWSPKRYSHLRVAYSTSPGMGPIINCCLAGHLWENIMVGYCLLSKGTTDHPMQRIDQWITKPTDQPKNRRTNGSTHFYNHTISQLQVAGTDRYGRLVLHHGAGKYRTTNLPGIGSRTARFEPVLSLPVFVGHRDKRVILNLVKRGLGLQEAWWSIQQEVLSGGTNRRN